MNEPQRQFTYAAISETPSVPVSAENIAMAVSRYRFAARFCAGGDVLEVACSTGHGLGLLGETAARIFAGDYEHPPLLQARKQCDGRSVLVRFDAQALPFGDRSFDAVVLFEAIYYLRDPARALREAHRVLRAGGKVILCFPNRAWPDFNPSAGSNVYYSAAEAMLALEAAGFRPRLYGGFEWVARGARAFVTSTVRRTAVRLGLVPRTMRAKALLKRVFYGTLTPFPADLRTLRDRFEEPKALTTSADAHPYKVLYAVGLKEPV